MDGHERAIWQAGVEAERARCVAILHRRALDVHGRVKAMGGYNARQKRQSLLRAAAEIMGDEQEKSRAPSPETEAAAEGRHARKSQRAFRAHGVDACEENEGEVKVPRHEG